MAKKKKKPAKAPVKLTDKNYLLSGRARKLPVYKCYINQDWQVTGLAHIIVTRQHVNGNVSSGIFLVDLLCAGVKDTFYRFNQSAYEFNEQIENYPLPIVECSYELAHNIIYGAIAFAEEYGIKPVSDFKITSNILEEDTEDIEFMDIDFGRNGKPFLIITPARVGNQQYYLQQLQKHAGPDGYHVVYEDSDLMPFDFDKDDFEEDEEDEEFDDYEALDEDEPEEPEQTEPGKQP